MSESAPLRIVFAGTPEFAVPPLLALAESRHQVIGVFTQPDKPAGRGRKLLQSPVKRQAESLNFPCLQPETLKSSDITDVLRELAPDVMVVVAYGQILPQSVLSLPVHGCLNIHASLLPRWRGAAPIQRAILAGDNKTGVSIMQMDAGLDTGPVLCTGEVDITQETIAATLHDQLAERGAKLIVDCVEKWCDGMLEATPQDDTAATYANKLAKSEANIDWNNPADAIHRQVRAFNPWPVAQTSLGGKFIRIWNASVARANVDAIPGTVLRCDRTALEVATSDGSLLLHELQLPGKKPVTHSEFVNGNDISGEVLGDG